MSPTSSFASDADPHAALLRRRADLFAQPLARGNIPKRRSDAICRLEHEVAATPPKTLAGALSQLEFAWENAQDDMHLTCDQRQAMRSAMALIQKLADP